MMGSINASAAARSRDAPVIIRLHVIATKIWPMGIYGC